MDPDAGMLAKKCTKLGGFAPRPPLAGIVGLTSCNRLNPKPLQLKTKLKLKFCQEKKVKKNTAVRIRTSATTISTRRPLPLHHREPADQH